MTSEARIKTLSVLAKSTAGLGLVLGLLFLSACQEKKQAAPNEMVSLSGKTMGTTYSIKYFPTPQTPKPEAVLEKIETTLKAVNQAMSTYIPDSEISLFNKSESLEWFEISADFHQVILHAQMTAEKTQGAFDATVMPLVNLWGFGPQGPKNSPSAAEVNETRSFVGFEKIEVDPVKTRLRRTHPKTSVDLSASAKGFGVDKVGLALEEMDVTSYMVEIGGEVRVGERKPNGELWMIAIEAPHAERGIAQKVLGLENQAMATSGSYRNFYEEESKMYNHTLDPQTGSPVQHSLVSVSVIDTERDCKNADALATALMVMGPERAISFAKDLNLAVYFIIQEGESERRFREHSSPRFLSLFP